MYIGPHAGMAAAQGLGEENESDGEDADDNGNLQDFVVDDEDASESESESEEE